MENFHLAVKALKSLNITFFITHGTLLGWYRECGIIKHTGDIDIGVPIEEMMENNNIVNIEKALAKEGFGKSIPSDNITV
jgi:hypothetical protein